MTVVLCSKGYPVIIKNIKIKNLNNSLIKKNMFIFHAGTKIYKNDYFSNGGRVLNITSVGKSFKFIRSNIFKTLKKINWNDGFFRKDIDGKLLSLNENY